MCAATLRAWERRYGVPLPQRTASAYRIYSDLDVAMIERLRDLCAEGMAPSAAAVLVRQMVTAPPIDPDQDPYARCRTELLAPIEAFDPAQLQQHVDRLAMLGPATAVVDQILRPVLVEVGERWHAGTMGVAQEHLATAMLTQLAHRLLGVTAPLGNRPTALLAGFAEEAHGVGLLALAVHLIGWGWQPIVLGPQTPPDVLGDAVTALRPKIVGLSVTIAPATVTARALLAGYSEACAGSPWIVGGAGAQILAPMVVAAGGRVHTDASACTALGTIEDMVASSRNR